MTNSESFRRLREQTQSNFDFAVLVCTAVPQLKYALKEYAKNPDYLVVQNAHFKPSEEPYSSEKRIMPSYKSVLGANFFLTSFSFFESYFFSLIDEMIDFHGGEQALLTFVRKRLSSPISEEKINLAHKLQKQHKGEHQTRYQKYTRELSQKDWIWPSDKFALYGIQQLITNRKKMKSADIPELLSYLLLFEINSQRTKDYHNIRDVRNKIAHGKKLSFDLAKAIEANQFLYKLATEIDRHVVQHFFVIERYR